MKKTAFASLMVAGFATSVSAADLPVKLRR